MNFIASGSAEGVLTALYLVAMGFLALILGLRQKPEAPDDRRGFLGLFFAVTGLFSLLLTGVMGSARQDGAFLFYFLAVFTMATMLGILPAILLFEAGKRLRSKKK